MEVGGLSSEVAALTETVVMSVLEAVVAETLLVAQRSAACLFIVVYTTSHSRWVFVKLCFLFYLILCGILISCSVFSHF